MPYGPGVGVLGSSGSVQKTEACRQGRGVRDLSSFIRPLGTIEALGSAVV